MTTIFPKPYNGPELGVLHLLAPGQMPFLFLVQRAQFWPGARWKLPEGKESLGKWQKEESQALP